MKLDLVVAVVTAEQLDVEPLALLDPVLLATGLDDCVHTICLVTGTVSLPAARRQPPPGSGRSDPRGSNRPAIGSSVGQQLLVDERRRGPRTRGSGRRTTRAGPRRSACGSSRTRPSSEMSNTWVRVLSRARASRKTCMTSSRLSRDLHVDEVDDDDAADVAQPQLAGDLHRRLEVVPEDRLLEARRAHVLAGVDVDHRERLGALDDQRAARRQPDLAVEGLVQLLVHVVPLEQRQRPRPRGRSTRPGRPARG